MLRHYGRLLARITGTGPDEEGAPPVSRNKAEKAINKFLDLVASAYDSPASAGVQSGPLEDFYGTTISALSCDRSGEVGGAYLRMVPKVQLRWAHYLQQAGRMDHLAVLLSEIADTEEAIAQTTQGQGAQGQGQEQGQGQTAGPAYPCFRIDLSSQSIAGVLSAPAAAASASASAAAAAGGSSRLELLSLRLALHEATNNAPGLRDTHAEAASLVRDAVAHPSVMGVVQLTGGKLALANRQWPLARDLLLDAFKAFEGAGIRDKTHLSLRLYLVAALLSNNRINPFDSQETKAYQRNPAVAPFAALAGARIGHDVPAFIRAVAAAKESFASVSPSASDLALVSSCLDQLVLLARTQALLDFVQPFSRVRIDRIAQAVGFDGPTATASAAAVALAEVLVAAAASAAEATGSGGGGMVALGCGLLVDAASLAILEGAAIDRPQGLLLLAPALAPLTSAPGATAGDLEYSVVQSMAGGLRAELRRVTADPDAGADTAAGRNKRRRGGPDAFTAAISMGLALARAGAGGGGMYDEHDFIAHSMS
jgi:hypothetical protein